MNIVGIITLCIGLFAFTGIVMFCILYEGVWWLSEKTSKILGCVFGSILAGVSIFFIVMIAFRTPKTETYEIAQFSETISNMSDKPMYTITIFQDNEDGLSERKIIQISSKANIKFNFIEETEKMEVTIEREICLFGFDVGPIYGQYILSIPESLLQ